MQIQEQSHNSKKCTKCKENFIYLPDEVQWREFGTYSAKITTCPYCGSVQIIKYENAFGLDVNNDDKFYSY